MQNRLFTEARPARCQPNTGSVAGEPSLLVSLSSIKHTNPLDSLRNHCLVSTVAFILIGCASEPTTAPVEVASVSMSPTTASLEVGQTVQLGAAIKDVNGRLVTGRTLSWSTSASGIAAVSASGLVTAIAPGRVSISATVDGGATASGIAGSVTVFVLTPARLHPAWTRDTTWNEGNPGMTLVYESEIVGGAAFRKQWTFIEVTDSLEAVRKGWKAQRFETRSGDCYGTDCFRSPVYERNEFAQALGENLEGDEYWYAWSFYVPVNGNSASWVFYGQFIQNPNHDSIWMFIKRAGQPFCAVFDWVRNNNWNCSGKNHVLLYDGFAGQWHDILVHAKWTTSTEGFTKIYVDDVLAVDYRGYTRTFGNDGVYFKYGIYRHASFANTVIYYDEVRRGRTREEVDIRSMEPKAIDLRLAAPFWRRRVAPDS